MSPRPAGVFWARTAPRAGSGAGGDRLCVDPAHGVYERKLVRRPRAGDGEGTGQVINVYACEVCWPREGAPARSSAQPSVTSAAGAPAWAGWGECLVSPLIGDGQRGCGAGPETARKHERHRGTLAPYVAVMRKHAHRFPEDVPAALLLDLTAGPLRYRDGAGTEYTGTGALALEAFDLAGLRSVAVFFEKVPDFETHARSVVGRRPAPRLGHSLVLGGDAWERAPEILELLEQQFRWQETLWPFGFLSLDANGEPDLEALGRLYRAHPALLGYVDIWIHLPARIMKFVRVVHGRGLLRDRLAGLPKSVWKIRPAGRGRMGWVELVGTNWDDAPTWGKQGFLDLRTPEGQAALDDETFTQAEQRERAQLAMALDD